jgi:ribosomal protein S12 methylthiotransferase
VAYSVGVVSLGCNKNRVDTETALGLLKAKGFELTEDPEQADILLVNTCGFIDSAKEESVNTILDMAQYKQSGRCRLLVVTGCLTQRYPEDLLKEIPEIDLLLGVNQYADLPAAIEKALRGERPACWKDDFGYFEHDRVLTTPSYSAYVRIGEGCSNRCTFCAIPLIRGPYRSRSEESVLREIRQLAAAGVREHILVAQDTTRFGTEDHPHTTLPDLMRKAASIEGVDWLRVLYCYPDETSDELLDVLAETDNVCPYLDIPLQHINADLLKRMRRRGTRDDILRCVRGARERGLTLRTTFIVGFPGETEEEFRETMALVEKVRYDSAFTFIYSPRVGTRAAEMEGQIAPEVATRRIQELIALQEGLQQETMKRFVGTEEEVLTEGLSRRSSESVSGKGRHGISITIPGTVQDVGEILRCRVTGLKNNTLVGERI